MKTSSMTPPVDPTSVPFAAYGYIVSFDSFMSGWGKAEGKRNYYVIPCHTHKQAMTAMVNMAKRSEMKNVSLVMKQEELPRNSDNVIVSFAKDNHVWFKENEAKRQNTKEK